MGDVGLMKQNRLSKTNLNLFGPPPPQEPKRCLLLVCFYEGFNTPLSPCVLSEQHNSLLLRTPELTLKDRNKRKK